jgi:hypothetical protein
MFIRNPLLSDKLIQDLLAGHSNLFFPILSPKKKGKNAPHVAVVSPAKYTLYVNTYSGVNIKSCAPSTFHISTGLFFYLGPAAGGLHESSSGGNPSLRSRAECLPLLPFALPRQRKVAKGREPNHRILAAQIPSHSGHDIGGKRKQMGPKGPDPTGLFHLTPKHL